MQTPPLDGTPSWMRKVQNHTQHYQTRDIRQWDSWMWKQHQKLYSLVKHLTGTTPNNPLPKHDDEEIFANEFADFFIGKIKKIRQELDNKPEYKPSPSNIPKLNSFRAVTEDKIKSIINKLATKSHELDPIPTSLLKAILPAVLPTITAIMNTSLRHGIFTNKWKIAIICPLLKKAGLDLIS